MTIAGYWKLQYFEMCVEIELRPFQNILYHLLVSVSGHIQLQEVDRQVGDQLLLERVVQRFALTFLEQ